MCTAVLSTESQADIQQIINLAEKLNVKSRIINNQDLDDLMFSFANESSLSEWLSAEEDEAWKNL